MRPILLALFTSAALTFPARAADLRYFEDAPLRAVQFVDANEGWAVGDEGVIWHTIDGGKHWERQPTGVRASLRSVHFLNPFTGWVVGRDALPHGAGSVGVVLVTQDGGLKWRHVNVNLLPGLNRVRFFNDKVGVVLGDGTDQFPTGVFTTTDGGHGWKPVPGPRCPSWLAADFQDAQTGALAGSWSRLATLREGALGAAQADDMLGGRSLNGLQIVGQRAVAVGDGGLVLLSNDTAGLRWGFANLKLPAEVTSCCDFHAVHCRGEKIWVVGRPGSVVLHSADHGNNWQLQATEQPLPLNGVFFLDEQHGWAVGELGTVLGTSDGGKSWAVQRQGGQLAAILFLHARAGGIPLDGMAVLGGDEGYLTTAVQVTSADPASAAPNRATERQILERAVRQAGGAAGETLWQFPLPEHLESIEKADLLQAWNRLHADRAAEQMLRQLVLALRIWQPDVVIADQKNASSAVDALVGDAVHEALKRAADPEAFPEQILRLGLKPCQPSKLYVLQDNKNAATIDLTEFRPRLQATARDFTAPAAGLLAAAPVTLPARRNYTLNASPLKCLPNGDLMQGITLAEGGAARRKLGPLPEGNPEIEKASATRRNLQALTETPVQGLTDPDRMLALLGPMLSELPDDQAAAAALTVANQLAQAGQWTLAREAFLLMADRFPAHPLTADAYRWLVRYNSSSEARRRQDLGQFIVVAQGQRGVPRPAGENKSPVNGVETVGGRQIALLASSGEARKWYQGSLEIEPRLAAFGPLVATDPAMQFCFQAARRNLGNFEEAREWYTHFVADHSTGPWHDAAAAELWLNNRSGTPPKPVVNCRQASERPFLDGNFDDACWHGLKPIVLRDAVGKTLKEYPTEAWMAYDKDFLYLALRCQHPPERYVAPVKVRQRDADLRPYDRVSLLLDLDRDYNTCFQLQIDQRGCLCEDCWGDRSWNPHWFVAVRSESTGWQIEAAIPLIELTGDSITPGRAWACNLVRVLPGRGVQALSLPADVQPRPEGMGLLLFTAEPQHPPAGSSRLSAN